MKTNTTLFALLLCIVGISSAHAAEPKAAESVNITQAITDDLYLAGGQVSIDAPVAGDIVAAGGELYLNDSLKGDALLAGGEMEIRGYVSDDIRATGGKLNLYSSVGGDLLVFGGEVTVHSGVNIAGDVILFAGDMEFEGNISGELRVYGGELDFNGTVGQSAFLTAGDIDFNGMVTGSSVITAGHMDLGPAARFEGPVRYWTDKGELDFGQAASSVTYDETLGEKYEDKEWQMDGGDIFGFTLYGLLASLLLAAILIFGLGDYFERAAVRVEKSFVRSFAFGILYFLGVPVLILVLFVTAIGLPLGLLLGAFYLFTLVFGATFAAVVFTNWLNNRNNAHWSKFMKLIVSGGAFLILWFLVAIPFVGWFASMVLVAAAFGGLLLSGSRNRIHADYQ